MRAWHVSRHQAVRRLAPHWPLSRALGFSTAELPSMLPEGRGEIFHADAPWNLIKLPSVAFGAA